MGKSVQEDNFVFYEVRPKRSGQPQQIRHIDNVLRSIEEERRKHVTRG